MLWQLPGLVVQARTGGARRRPQVQCGSRTVPRPQTRDGSGVSARSLRFYERVEVLSPPVANSSGYREYDNSALPRLAFVRAAQGCGLSLAEIRQIIAVRDDSGPPCTHVVALLDTHAAPSTPASPS